MQSVGHFRQGHECLQISTPEEFPELWILRVQPSNILWILRDDSHSMSKASTYIFSMENPLNASAEL